MPLAMCCILNYYFIILAHPLWMTLTHFSSACSIFCLCREKIIHMCASVRWRWCHRNPFFIHTYLSKIIHTSKIQLFPSQSVLFAFLRVSPVSLCRQLVIASQADLQGLKISFHFCILYSAPIISDFTLLLILT